jgi:membrane-bound lytic murein transglycosylase B
MVSTTPAPGATSPHRTTSTPPSTTLTTGQGTATTASVPATVVDRAPLPTSAATLGSDLDRAERAIRDPAISDTDAAPWGRRLQRLYRLLSANPDWAADAMAAVSEEIRPDVELNWAARQDLDGLVGSGPPSSTLPAWEIRDPLPVDELLGYYHEAENQTGVPWSILAAINLIETRMGRIVGLSTAGAIGPMQFLPTTWAECCVGDPAVDRDAILGAAAYLVQRGAIDDLDRAIFGYNNSDRYVRAVRAYASVMDRDDRAYRGYHAFEVYFSSSAGLIVLPPDYLERQPVDVETWLTEHPEALVEN